MFKKVDVRFDLILVSNQIMFIYSIIDLHVVTNVYPLFSNDIDGHTTVVRLDDDADEITQSVQNGSGLSSSYGN